MMAVVVVVGLAVMVVVWEEVLMRISKLWWEWERLRTT